MGKVPLPILKELEHQARQNISMLNVATVKSQIKKSADPEKAVKRGYGEACEYLVLWNKTILM